VPVRALDVALRVTDEVVLHVRRVAEPFGRFGRRWITRLVGSPVRRPPEQQELLHVAREVLEVVRSAARQALDDGAARLELTTVAERYGPGVDHEGFVVVLTPEHPRAARVVVELQHRDLWWLTAGDGPGLELSQERREDRVALLTRPVQGVVAGSYEHA